MAVTLQVNFKLGVSADEWRKIADQFAPEFAAVPGLVWKVWNLNEQTGEGGGFYLFADPESLQQFAASPLAEQIKAAPFLKELSLKTYDVMEAPTRVTHGATVIQAPVSV